MTTRRWNDRLADWWLGLETRHATPPNLRSDKPTATELADLLEELTVEGMPPRAQARHVAWHWPGMVRKEEGP